MEEALRGGWLAGCGSYTRRFEQRVANLFGKRYGLFVNSGSSANILALAALDLPKGSKVVTPACTFATTVAPILQVGLQQGGHFTWMIVEVRGLLWRKPRALELLNLFFVV